MSSPKILFPVFLVLTVLLLIAVLVTGLTGRVRAHLTLVGLTVTSLAITIYYAEQLGELYDLASAGWITPVHLAIAKAATGSYLLPLVTGLMTLRKRTHKRLHFRMAMVAFTLTVLAAGTGVWMLAAATPLPA
jgi:hypothetical protein